MGAWLQVLVTLRPAAGCRLLGGHVLGLILSGRALAKALYKVPFPWAGIWRAYPRSFASDPAVGKSLRLLIGRLWSWRSSLLSCASAILVGTVLLSVRQPLRGFVFVVRLHSSSVESPAGC
jgi:hypothetical protein